MKPARFPRLYAIVDAESFSRRKDPTIAITRFATELAAGGVTLLQYRNKKDDARQMLSQARELRRALQKNIRLVMNDRADLCLAANCDGVQLGQEDLSLPAARRIVGAAKVVGVSTHNLDQLQRAASSDVDYIAVGPIFATQSKPEAEPVVGLELLRQARNLTGKPLVAIGGITRKNCRSVLDAGADAVAVISDLLELPRKSAEEFLRVLE